MSGNRLDAYLARKKLSYAAFASSVGADRARIARIACSYRKPGLELALAIEKETGGEVPASYWPELKLVPEPRRVRRAARSSAGKPSNRAS